MEIKRITSSTPHLILVKNFLKNTFNACKSLGVLEQYEHEASEPAWWLQEYQGQALKGVKWLRPQKVAMVVAVLLLGGLELILGPGVFTVFDLHKMDMPLTWKEQAVGVAVYRTN
eukprot:scaffold62310_cov22-Tisochrysis_lutea.AAC.1